MEGQPTVIKRAAPHIDVCLARAHVSHSAVPIVYPRVCSTNVND
jgi:hypothetical protein